MSETKQETKQETKMKLPDSMLTPESQAATTALVTGAVREALASIMKDFVGPLLEKVSLTPEKWRDAEELRRAPSAAQAARETRERKLMAEETAENRRNKEALQAGCPHRYPSGQLAISCVHNFPDRQARGTCMVCGIWIHPKEWRIDAPDAQHPRGTPRIVDAHPLYHLVQEVEAM